MGEIEGRADIFYRMSEEFSDNRKRQPFGCLSLEKVFSNWGVAKLYNVLGGFTRIIIA
jgi:hypothetical protein